IRTRLSLAWSLRAAARRTGAIVLARPERLAAAGGRSRPGLPRRPALAALAARPGARRAPHLGGAGPGPGWRRRGLAVAPRAALGALPVLAVLAPRPHRPVGLR